MMRVFNMGVGLILVTSPEKADGVVAALGDGDTRGWIMGEVETGEGVRLA
jgi:phosphoribosylaminoimidazole (AIR) synthetase